MAYLNAVMRGVFDAVLYPMQGWHPLLSLGLVSLVVGVGMLLVFKVTSNQEKLAEVKRRIQAGIFEIRLFNDDIRAIFRAQSDILRHNLTYMRLSLVPLAWMIVPFVLIIAQLQFHYGYEGLEPGRATLLKVSLHETGRGAPQSAGVAARRPDIRVRAPDGLRVETAGVWIPSLNEIAWRLSADRPGDYEVDVVFDGRTYAKTVHVSDEIVRRSPLRVEPALLSQLIYPAEPPLPADGGIREIEVVYPDRGIPVLGWELHWLIVFFVLTIVFAFVLRNRLGVTI